VCRWRLKLVIEPHRFDGTHGVLLVTPNPNPDQAWARAAEAAQAQEQEAAAGEADDGGGGGDDDSGSDDDGDGDSEAADGGRDRGADASTSDAAPGGQQLHPHQQPRLPRSEWRKQCAARRAAARAAAPPGPEDRNMPPGAPLGLSREALWAAAVGVISDLGDAEAAARVGAELYNWYRLMRVGQILVANPGAKLSDMDIDTQREPDYDFRWG
jgi:hypothetical protein